MIPLRTSINWHKIQQNELLQTFLSNGYDHYLAIRGVLVLLIWVQILDCLDCVSHSITMEV